MQSTKRWKEITTEEALLLADLGVDVHCAPLGGGTILNLGALTRTWPFVYDQRAFIHSRGTGPWYIPDDDD